MRHMQQKDQKNMLRPASIGEKAKDNNLLVRDTETHMQYGSIYSKGNGRMMQTKLKSIQRLETCTWTR
jgi:hypothetical protein